MVSSFAIGEARKDPQHAFFEGQIEAKATPNGEVVAETLREGHYAWPPTVGQAAAIERNPPTSCFA